MDKTIGIIGQGFVGTAIREGMKHVYHIETYDKFCKDKSTCDSLEELCNKTDVIFLCVPTPMFEDGSCDISIVKGCVKEISEISEHMSIQHTVCLKSTIPPGTTQTLQSMVSNILLVHQPEFLTEKNANKDFKDQKFIVVGGEEKARSRIVDVYKESFPNVPITKCSSRESETVKYFINNFLSVKVALAAEFYEICHNADIDYDSVMEIVKKDKRVGDSHWQVPGPMPMDGLKPGDVNPRLGLKEKNGKLYSWAFSGSCFCKDINAMISWCKEHNMQSEMLSAAWDKNVRIRPEKDWESLVDRACSKKHEE